MSTRLLVKMVIWTVSQNGHLDCQSKRSTGLPAKKVNWILIQKGQDLVASKYKELFNSAMVMSIILLSLSISAKYYHHDHDVFNGNWVSMSLSLARHKMDDSKYVFFKDCMLISDAGQVVIVTWHTSHIISTCWFQKSIPWPGDVGYGNQHLAHFWITDNSTQLISLHGHVTLWTEKSKTIWLHT